MHSSGDDFKKEFGLYKAVNTERTCVSALQCYRERVNELRRELPCDLADVATETRFCISLEVSLLLP